MSDFRRLSDTFFVSPQISLEDIAAAAAAGISLVVNNRPDGEAPDQPDGETIELAARAAGMDYLAIPVTAVGFSEPQISSLKQALGANTGPVLAYCRSGTRSTLLWALTQASSGAKPDAIASAAQAAGYDVGPVRPAMDMLAARAQG